MQILVKQLYDQYVLTASVAWFYPETALQNLMTPTLTSDWTLSRKVKVLKAIPNADRKNQLNKVLALSRLPRKVQWVASPLESLCTVLTSSKPSLTAHHVAVVYIADLAMTL